MDVIDTHQATLVGHSMGGNISQEIAFRFPQRVTSLIIIDSTCNTGRLTRSEQWQVRFTPLIFALYPYRLLLRQAARSSSLKPDIQEYIYNTSFLLTFRTFSQTDCRFSHKAVPGELRSTDEPLQDVTR